MIPLGEDMPPDFAATPRRQPPQPKDPWYERVLPGSDPYRLLLLLLAAFLLGGALGTYQGMLMPR